MQGLMQHSHSPASLYSTELKQTVSKLGNNAQRSVEKTIIVGTVKRSADGKRIRDRKLPCFVCRSEVLWLSRHLEQRHSDNILVAQVLAKTGAERKKGFRRLKNLGTFQHNIDVLKKGNGHLIVARRPNDTHSIHSYLPCVQCYGFFYRYDLWRHVCPCDGAEPSSEKNPDRSCVVVERSRALLDGALEADKTGADKDLKKHILNRMRGDKIYDIVKSDELILKFGSALLKRVGVKGRHHISARMRLLGSLVKTLQRNLEAPGKPLATLLDGAYFDDLLKAVEELSGAKFNEHGQRVFSKPAIVMMMGSLISKCCNLKKGMAARRNDGEEMSKEVNRFLVLYDAYWSDCMSCPASASQKDNTYNRADELPTTDDLVKLKEYTEKQLNELSEILAAEPSYKYWRALSELVLTRLLVFNKRRASQPAKLLLSQYINRPDWNQTANQELIDNLQPLEKVLMKRMDLIQVPGKRNRRVPILITPEVGKAMQLLANTRASCDVPMENKYFFATDSIDGHLDPWLVLHNNAINAGVARPKQVTSRNLRKYVATLAQIPSFLCFQAIRC